MRLVHGQGEAASRMDSLDALRAISALLVMMWHFTNGNNIFKLKEPAVMQAVGSVGWVGVDIFFIISGFVIPYVLWKSNYQIKNGYFSFLARRVVRLYPPFLMAGLLGLALNYLSSRLPGWGGGEIAPSITDLLCNLTLTCDVLGGTWLIPVFWSLAIEIQYYVVAALVFPLLLRSSTVRIVLYSLVLAAVLLGQGLNFVRWPMLFLLGFSLFLFKHSLTGSREFQFACVALLGSMALAYDLRVFSAGVFALIYILFLNGVVWKPVVFLGSISYSIYLLHVPFGGRLVNLAVRYDVGGSVDLLVVLAATVISLVAAWLFFKGIEAPSIRLSKRIGRPHETPLSFRPAFK